MVRIVIDARKLGDFGIGEYIKQLLLAFRDLARSDQVFFLHAKDRPPAFAMPAHFHPVPVAVPRYSMQEFFLLGRHINRLRPQVVHIPHYTAPLSVRAPLLCTIHDLIHLHMMDVVYTPAHRWYAHTVLRYAVKRAQRIIAVSQATRRDLVRFFPACANKLAVVHNGVEAQPAGATGKRPTAPTADYYLYVGNCKAHKNLINLIRAYEIYRQEAGQPARLVLAGVASNPDWPWLKKYLSRYTAWQNIDTTGFLPRSRLFSLYRGCRALCLVSMHEGFGLPALEAASQQRPVIASKPSPMQEFLQQNVLWVNPFSIRQIADAFHRVPEMEAEPAGAPAALCWQSTAEKTYALYREAVHG